MGSLLRLASLNWSSLRRHNSTPLGSLITHSAVSASNCTSTSFSRLTAPTYILPWYGPILPQSSTRLGAIPSARQGQRSLKRCSGKDFQQKVFVPTTTAAFHGKAVAVGMLLQE